MNWPDRARAMTGECRPTVVLWALNDSPSQVKVRSLNCLTNSTLLRGDELRPAMMAVFELTEQEVCWERLADACPIEMGLGRGG